MIGKYLRPVFTKIITPIAKGLLKIGVTPNMMTVFGTVLNSVLAIYFFAISGHLIIGALVLGALVFVDMIDGAMAREIGSGTPFGAVLDASLDRIADGAIFGSIFWWIMMNRPGDYSLMVATLITLVFSGVISYTKARAEASGIPITVGIIERPERLIISLVAVELTGLALHFGVGWLVYAIHVAMWILAVGSVITVLQRLLAVYKHPEARQDFAKQQ